MATSSYAWLKGDKKRSQLLVLPQDDKTWYNDLSTKQSTVSTITTTTKVIPSSVNGNIANVNSIELKKVQEIIAKEFKKEEEIYLKLRRQVSNSDVDEKWIRDVVQSGTLSDKIAALALIIQESPLHNLESLDTLLSFCSNKKEQRSCQLAMDALKDLFIHNILPDRKLQSFASYYHSGIFTHHDTTMSMMLSYYYENQLISRIQKFVDRIEEIGLKSNVEYFKKYCMDIACELLINKPEQEARLLNMLVNKLGDPVKGIVSKCIECLDKIMSVHYVMKGVIVREIRQFINRPNLPSRSLYIAINFLTSISLTRKDAITDVTIQLIECYISLFERATKQNDFGSKLLSCLLHGINRAYPYLHDKKSLLKHIDTLFKIAHTDHFSTAVQALTLISHIALNTDDDYKKSNTNSNKNNSSNNSSSSSSKNHHNDSHNGDGNTDSDMSHSTTTTIENERIINRFYRALYSLLFSDQILSRSRNTLFFRLLFRSLKLDRSDVRRMAFIKKMTMISLHCNSAITAGLLLLLSEACSIGTNTNAKNKSNIALLGKMLNINSATTTSITPTSTIQEDDPSSSVMAQLEKKIKKERKNSKTIIKMNDDLMNHTALVHEVEEIGITAAATHYDSSNINSVWFDSYDALKREPLYAVAMTNTSSSSSGGGVGREPLVSMAHGAPILWESALLNHHFHPSVKAFTNHFTHAPYKIDFTGDPLVDFSVTAFLNRFAYKNPKKKKSSETNGDDKDMTSGSNASRYHAAQQSEEPINLINLQDTMNATTNTPPSSSSSGNTSVVDLTAPDKQFFYKYFGERNKLRLAGEVRDKSKRKKNKNSQSNDDDDDDDEGGDGEVDEEGEVDMFATQLAEDMMRSHKNNIDPDDDDDVDFSDDDDEDDDDDDDDDDDEIFQNANDSDDDDDDDEMEFDDFTGNKNKNNSSSSSNKSKRSLKQDDDDDDDDDDDYELMAYGDDDDDDDNGTSKRNQLKINKSKSNNKQQQVKKNKKQKRNDDDDDEGMSDFAAAEDYDDEIDTLMKERFNANGNSTSAISMAATKAAEAVGGAVSASVNSMTKKNPSSSSSLQQEQKPEKRKAISNNRKRA